MNYKAYLENSPEDMILRDHLAFDRTILANQRTGLAYIRTVLVALATGFTLIKLFPDDKLFLIIGLLSIGIAAITGGIGVAAHLKFQQKIATIYHPSKNMTAKKVPSENKEIELISQ